MSNKCQALINQGPNKGNQCTNLTNDKYCNKHIRNIIVDKSITDNVRYCDISRGCYNVLEGGQQMKCKICLQKSRINDRKRGEKKRLDSSLCLDCGIILTDNIRAIGKKNKELRRCKSCYDKLLEVEQNRPKRERNYKQEGFKNKYVVWNSYIKGAKQRKLDFTLSKVLFNELLIKPCFYCGYYNLQEINGIDRIDNNKGYTDNNVVTCCSTCNIAKGTNHPQEFIDKMFAIYEYKLKKEPIKSEIMQKWSETYLSKTKPTFNNYSKSANSRNLEFKITKDEFNNIIAQPCYLCGIASADNNSNGIDRFDNYKGYILDNCRSCCGHCNLMKKDVLYDKLIKISEGIHGKYNELTEYFKAFDIKIRNIKVDKRIVSDNNIILVEKELRHYKPINEIIEQSKENTNEINNIIEIAKESNKLQPVKQWKAKQVYETIAANNENIYKEYCEQNNDISKIQDWNNKWVTFVLSIKSKSFEEAKEIIKRFIEDLRRIRHNELCYTKNSVLVDREDRKQWPAITVVRAFLDGKLDTFKKYTEEQTGDNPDDPKWQKRWDVFVESLEENKDNESCLKEICSKFMTAQRAKRYRHMK